MKTPLLPLLVALLALPAAASDLGGLDADTSGLRFSRSAPEPVAGTGPKGGETVRGAPARDADAVDLRPQFADPNGRDQCDVGSCHAFGAVGVLEAAYFRKHGKAIKLSEADLFLQETVLNGDIYNQFCSQGKCEVSEGNNTAEDLRRALRSGVATNMSYAAFLERWRRFRAAEQKTMEGIVARAEEDSRGFYGWVASFLYDPKTHWRQLSTSDQSRRILERYLSGNTDLAASRAETLKGLAGFSLATKDYEYLGGPKARELGDAGCRAAGDAQAKAVSAELKAGRPVVVSMTLGGLQAWKQTDASQHANHAFVLVGQGREGGRLVFQSRNSWGGLHPPVPQEHACRIYSVSSVLIPGEKAAF